MSARVFETSTNVKEDQAKILFDYYKAAATKIVNEEVAIEKIIQELQTEREEYESTQGKHKVTLIVGIVITVAFVILGIVYAPAIFVLAAIGAIVAIVNAVKMNGDGKLIAELDEKIDKAHEDHKNIRRDYKIKKMGVLYVPIAKKVPFGNGSVEIDLSNREVHTDFRMSVLNKPDEWQETLSSLKENIENIPIVDTVRDSEPLDTSKYSTSMQSMNMSDYVGNMHRQIRNVKYLLSDKKSKSVSLPFVKPNSKYDKFLSEYATDKLDVSAKVLNVYSEESFKDSMKTFEDVQKMKESLEADDQKSGNHVDYYKALMKTLGESMQMITASKMNSSSSLVEYYNRILMNVLKSAYNNYSPVLEAENIEKIKEVKFDYVKEGLTYKPFTLKSSSRVKYDLFQSNWVAEDSSKVLIPFAVNQIKEEIFAPLIQNLMDENEKERRSIYADIENQKRDYGNQWHRDSDDFYARNLQEANRLGTEFAKASKEFNAALNTYNALSETMDGIRQGSTNTTVNVKNTRKETLEKMMLSAAMCQRVQNEFQDFIERVQEDIDNKTEQFEHIENYNASLRDREFQDIAKSSDDLQNLDERRKALVGITPYVAKNAELPPELSLEQSLQTDSTINLVNETSVMLQDLENSNDVEDHNLDDEIENDETSEKSCLNEDDLSNDVSINEKTEESDENIDDSDLEDESGENEELEDKDVDLNNLDLDDDEPEEDDSELDDNESEEDEELEDEDIDLNDLDLDDNEPEEDDSEDER